MGVPKSPFPDRGQSPRVVRSTIRSEMFVYLSHLPELLKEHEGEYVVVVGGSILGTWEDRQDAMNAAVDKVGTGPFMIREIRREVRVARFSRDIS